MVWVVRARVRVCGVIYRLLRLCGENNNNNKKRDLHTVDKGVLSNLSNELAKDDWEVLVAHFLGVDHVGHTFGPASQAMEDKLDEIDAALRCVPLKPPELLQTPSVDCGKLHFG